MLNPGLFLIELITITVFNCFLWVTVSLVFRRIVKKLWLLTLFPLTIYTVASLVLITATNKYFLLTPILLLNIYYVVSLIKGVKLIDTLLIPILSYIILTVVTLSTKYGV